MIVADASVIIELLLQTQLGAAVEDRFYRGFDVRHGHLDFIGRAWDLRATITAYQAMHIAVTCDRRLARSRGHSARIELIA